MRHFSIARRRPSLAVQTYLISAQPPLFGGTLSAALHFGITAPATPTIKKRTFMTVILSLNLIFFTVTLGSWTGLNVLTSFNPDMERQTIHNPPPSTNSLPSRTT